MKRVLTILLLVPFIMVLAPPYHAAGYGEIAISLVDVPAELQERSVLVTLGSDPNDTDTVLVVLNGLNQHIRNISSILKSKQSNWRSTCWCWWELLRAVTVS